MKAHYGLELLAIATILIVGEIENIEAIPSKPKPGTSLKGRNTDLPKRMMELQKKIDDTIAKTKKKITDVEREINKTTTAVVNVSTKDSLSARAAVTATEKKELEAFRKTGNSGQNNKKERCIKETHREYGLSLDSGLETALECVNETLKTALESIEKIKNGVNDSYATKNGHSPLTPQWTPCMWEPTNACEPKFKTEMKKRLEETEQSFTETQQKTTKTKTEHEKATQECLSTYKKNLRTSLEKYKTDLKNCKAEKTN